MSEESDKPLTAGDGAGIASVLWMFAIMGLTVLLQSCHDKETEGLKAKAVELHAADWVVNPKNGITKFTWKDGSRE